MAAVRFDCTTGAVEFHCVGGGVAFVCGGTGTPCDRCDTDTTPASVLLSFTGSAANGSCASCSSITTPSYVLDQLITPCHFQYTATHACGELEIVVEFNEGQIYIAVRLDTVTIAEAFISGLPTPTYNCQTSRSETLVATNVTKCDMTGVTVTVSGA